MNKKEIAHYQTDATQNYFFFTFSAFSNMGRQYENIKNINMTPNMTAVFKLQSPVLPPVLERFELDNGDE